MDIIEVCEQLTKITGLDLRTNTYYQRIYVHGTGIYVQRFFNDEYEVRMDDIDICLLSDLKELPVWIGESIEALIRFKDSELNNLIYMKEKLTEIVTGKHQYHPF